MATRAEIKRQLLIWLEQFRREIEIHEPGYPWHPFGAFGARLLPKIDDLSRQLGFPNGPVTAESTDVAEFLKTGFRTQRFYVVCPITNESEAALRIETVPKPKAVKPPGSKTPIRSVMRIVEPRDAIAFKNDAMRLILRWQAHIEAQPEDGPPKFEHITATLKEVDRAVLIALFNRHPALIGQEDLAQATHISRKTVGESLDRLRSAGYVHRPSGERSGETVTEKGADVAKAILDATR